MMEKMQTLILTLKNKKLIMFLKGKIYLKFVSRNKESSKDIKNISPNQTMKTEESPSKSPQKQEITKTTSPQKAEPEPEEEDDEEMFDYELLPLELHANEAIDFLKNYSNKIDSKFNVTYNTPEYIFEECFKGNNAQ